MIQFFIPFLQEKQQRMEKQRQTSEFRRTTTAQDRCLLCFNSPARKKELTLSIAHTTYLALPPRGILAPGHCIIVPAEHVPSTRQTDEATWTEIRNFKKCLLRMAMAQVRLFFSSAIIRFLSLAF